MVAPAATQAPPFRWDRVRAGIGEWAGWALGLPDSAILWSAQRVNRPALPYLLIERVSGPTSRGLACVRRRWPAPASTLITTLLPAVGDAARFRVDGWTVTHVRAPGEDLADVRDGLLAECDQALHLAGWSAAATGGAGITIVPDALGDVGEVVPLWNCTSADTTTYARRVTLQLESRVRISCIGARSQSPTEWAATLRLAVDDDETRARLRRYGLTLKSRAIEVDPRDVDAPPEVEEVAAIELMIGWQGHRTTAGGSALAGAMTAAAAGVILTPDGDIVDVGVVGSTPDP